MPLSHRGSNLDLSAPWIKEAERYFKECLELDATAAVLSTEFFENKFKSERANS